MKKKALSILLAAAMAGALLTGCGGSSSSTEAETTEETTEETAEEETEEAAEEETAEEADTEGAVYNIAIVKQMDHASLDEIAEAIEAELDVIAEENGVTINYETYSGQGEQSVLTQIGTQVVSEGVDAIIPIATLAAQVMVTCAEESQTPVIFAAISDPEGAELTDIDYLTGTSDALNTEFIMDMMFAQNADIQKVGLLYSLSEDNSTTPIAEAKAYLDAAGIEYVEKTANTNDEVITAASALIAEGVDTIFTPTDNVVMAAELAIYENLIDAGILHYTGADSFVRNGAFATCGVNYTELGYETADLAYEAIINGMADMEDYYLMDGGIITVNTETAEAIGADYSMFADMGELVEVITTED
ncbi:MAG: ABC transporter substrate-binding protein [Lachnospiraceae bacterium]|nr:ABC transporter substrate-binding protein [Lachnospiraceae bacterium]